MNVFAYVGIFCICLQQLRMYISKDMHVTYTLHITYIINILLFIIIQMGMCEKSLSYGTVKSYLNGLCEER